MRRPTKTVFMHYGVALVVTALAVGLRLLLDPWLGDHLPFLTLFAAVAFAAWFGGRGPALLAIVAGAFAAAYFLLQPRYSFAIDQAEYQFGVVLYVIVGCATVALFESLRSQKRQLEEEVNARRTAEQVLAEREEVMRITFASIGDAVLTTDASGNVTFMNVLAQELTGWTQGEAEGKPLSEVFNILNEESRQPVENPFEKALREGRVVGLANHTLLVSKDGTERPIDDSAATIRNNNDRIIGVILTFRDVTDRKRIEEEERAGRKRLRMALTAARMVAWEFDPATRMVVTSNNAAEVFGLPPGAIIKNADQGFALIHRDDVERHLATMMKAFEECGAYLSHYRMVRPDSGAIIWLEERGHAVSEDPHKAVRLVGVVMDVTERKQQEIRLKESEERLSAVIEAIPQVVWTAQTNGEFDFGSRRWYDYTGLTPEQTLGIAWTSAVHPDDRAQTATKWQTALATSEPTEIEYRLRAADGCYRWQLIRGVPLKNSGGQVVKWFGTITDIHVLKQAEQELQENDRRKDEFLATLAHELRNPLAPIRNGLQVMRMANGNPDAVEQARNMMERQLTQMVRLVDDLLDISRISSGKLELKKERVPLLAVVNSAIETSRPLIEQMGHKLTVTLPKHSIVVEADLTRLAQVFLNLLNNAAKYSDRGGHIWLTAERQGSDVVVSVKDEGIGISADQMPRIFEMFSQVNRSLEKAQGGLGIGLTLVRRLVEMHGGRIEARSDGPGKGSEFIVRLPVVVEASIPQQEDARTEGDRKSTLRILVVDDNRDNADSLSMMLKMMGNETQTAYDGEEAVAVAVEFLPNVVLLDIGLPKLTGYEVCRRIREQPGGKELVIIAQTGWGQEDDRQRTHEVGFDHHMVKPVDPQALMKLLAGLQTAKA
jgi:PAS domain S-box-containing protein